MNWRSRCRLAPPLEAFAIARALKPSSNFFRKVAQLNAPRVERTLSAVLAADVVGYSRLMERDEGGTFERLKAHRTEMIEPLIAQYRGRIVKLTGDGALCDFHSVVDAVACALLIQQTIAEREMDIPEEERIRLRIGINLGDVIREEDGDLYGDGVNIAARLEGLAEPGGLCISGTAYDHLRGKVDCVFEDLGERALKNIERPVRMYRALLGDAPAPSGPAPLPVPERPSIAVLPFNSMSVDPEQAFFSDGITEDITTALSKLKSFFVIARNTMFTYKGKPVDVRAVGRSSASDTSSRGVSGRRGTGSGSRRSSSRRRPATTFGPSGTTAASTISSRSRTRSRQAWSAALDPSSWPRSTSGRAASRRRAWTRGSALCAPYSCARSCRTSAAKMHSTCSSEPPALILATPRRSG